MATLAQGTVFRLKGDKPFKSGDYHVFVVVGRDNNGVTTLFVVNGTTQISGRSDYFNKRPEISVADTTVTIPKGVYKFFSKETMIDCNTVHRIVVDEINFDNDNLLFITSDKLSQKDTDAIVTAIQNSRLVREYVKKSINKMRAASST